MKIQGTPYRSIYLDADSNLVKVIDQTLLPFEFKTLVLSNLDDAARAISDMIVRGAPLIGATAAWGMALAMGQGVDDSDVKVAYEQLLATRPTAVNLRWALDDMHALLMKTPEENREEVARKRAQEICDEDVEINAAIGRHGLELLRKIWKERKEAGATQLNILTHCNAGWLATVDWGTALSPIYMAFEEGIPVHVWVDETRPRNQGANLTAWELGEHGVPYHLIADNVGGHLMQHGMVDLCIVGTDRTSSQGDVANKIGTYLKALAAFDNQIPFYVAAPSPSIDWSLRDGIAEIPIEERSPEEVTRLRGKTESGAIESIQIGPTGAAAANFGFDVTPARLVTAIITERGVCEATEEGLSKLFGDKK